MFRELTKEEVWNMRPGTDEVFITEVGDGEYQFNVFGNAFKDIGTMLRAFEANNSWYNRIALVASSGRYSSLPLGSRDGDMRVQRIFVGGFSELRVTLLAKVTRVSTAPFRLNLGG